MGRFESVLGVERAFSDLGNFAERAADIFYKVLTVSDGAKINVDGLKSPIELGEKRHENEGLNVLDYKDYLVFFGREGRRTIITRVLEQKDLGRLANVNRTSLHFLLRSFYDSQYNPRKLLPSELDEKEMMIRNSLKTLSLRGITASELWDSYWYSTGKAIYMMILGSQKVT